MARKDSERTKEELVAEQKAMRQKVVARGVRVRTEGATEERLRRLNMVLRAIRNINQLIAHGADRNQLLRGACYNLVKNRGYYSTWVALFDEAGKLVASSQAGLGRDFSQLKRMLERGELPPCAKKALEAMGAVVIETARGVCAGCPLESKYGDSAKISVRLAYSGKVYGVITVSTLPGIVGDGEEEGLLEEVAADIAFALHSLEAEEVRRSVEEELRRSEERYRTVVESAAESITVSQGRRIVYANRRALRMSGYTLEEITAMGPFDIFHPEDREKALDRFREWLRGERLSRWYPLRVLLKDGGVRWVVINNALTTWEGRRAVVSLMTDVTEQVEMEETLKRSEERYRTLVDNSTEGIVVLRGDKVVFANRRVLRTSGYGMEELQQMSMWDLFHPEDLDKARRRLEGWLKGERQPRYYPLRVVLRDGSIRWVLFNVNNITWDGKPALLVLMEDVTEQKRLEDMLIESEQRYRTVLDEMDEAYFEVDLRGNLVFFSDALARQLGYSPEELVGMNYRKYAPEEDWESIFQAFNQVYRTGEPLRWLYAVQVTKDGRRIDVEYSVLPRRNEKGEIIGFRGVARDITERKQMEEALRKSEERFRTVLEEVNEGYYETDLRGTFTFVSDAMVRQLGYSREELIGMNYRTYVPQEEWDGVFKAFNQVYRTGQPLKRFGITNITKDGRKIFLEDTVLVRRNEKGEVVGFRGIARDITERKRMEEALQRSEERYRTLVENANEAISVIQDGIIKFANARRIEMTGYTVAELNAMPHGAIVHPDDRDRVKDYLERRLRGEEAPTSYELRIIDKQGNIRWLERHAALITWEGRLAVLVLDTDVTDRRQMEEALRRSEERFRTVLDEMEDSYFELDIAGNFTFVNDATCRVMGYSRGELLGNNYRMLVAREDWEKVFKVFNEVYRTGRPQKGVIFRIVRKDGSTGVGELVALPLRDEKGEVIGFRGVGRDVTERVRAEEERRELERRAQLAARLASVGEMASGIAHEINNPLTGVIGYAQLLLVRKDIPEDMRTALEVINESAQRVASILRRLLTFARQYKPERRLVNINEVIEAALRIRAYHLETSNITVTTQLAPNLPAIVADPGQLQQVFLNIIMNAEAAMKRVPRRGRLVVKTEALDSVIRISFKDNGPGIAPEHLERIFEPFFTTSEVGEGTGLGLSVCHGIITEHKGRIWAESQLGKGATFFIELPVETMLAEEKVVTPAEAPARPGKARILVVDDEAVVREFVSQVLRAEGCKVDAAGSAEEALEKVRSGSYQLLLLDIKMPGTSGIDLYRRLRRLAPSLTKRTLFITGDVMGERTRDFLARTGAPYLVKPFDASKLLAEVSKALSGS